ncbi:hypothetical protein KC19_VG245900 [Ceratodon purpureus]|uniref:Nuclear pore complex protein Nup214 n=1 Tax=Ceratodon purpureus TaxID=3225 RepID=A0A8T0HT66_CERPU|nr:hypothetical protein KC19_VG245900 [Ceratodon purpureus]
MEVTEARREGKDVLFRRIGVDVPLSEGSEPFSDSNAPVRGLVVSNRYGITAFVHPGGFVVTRTSNIVDVAQQAKDDASGRTAQQDCYMNVSLSGVLILCLSRDELTLAACVGERTVKIYDIPTLFHKLDSKPLESRDIPEGRVKDFRWSPANDEIYAVLSREGQLFSGHVGETPLCVVNNNVVAVSWSSDGKHVAYLTNKRSVCVSNSKFESQYNFDLPAEIGDFTDNLQVESLQWVRPDAMLVAYIQTNEDGEEDACPLILVTSSGGDLAKEGGTITAVFFDGNFPSIDSGVLPADSSPYMLAEYIKPWEMVIAASRRSVDDHIVNLGWSSSEKKHEAFSIEIRDDTWLPRIELQANEDDNILLGLAVDMTTGLEVTDPRDDSGDTKLPACPVLMCLSLGGMLSLFSVARLDENTAAASLVSPPSTLPESNRAEVKSKTSVERVPKASQSGSFVKETSALQLSKNREVEEKIPDEQSISSGSETDREDDGSHNEEVLSRLPAPGVRPFIGSLSGTGKFGSLIYSQRKNLAVKDGSSVLAKDTSSVSCLQTHGALALSSLVSSGASNISRLNTAKSAPSGLDLIQQTAPTPQPSTLLTRTVTQVQSFSKQTSSFSSLSSVSLKHPHLSGPGLGGQAGNDKGNSGPFSSSLQGNSSSSLSSCSFKALQTSGFGFLGQVGNDKDTNSLQSTSLASLLSGSLRPQQPFSSGFINQAGNDKCSRASPSTQKPSLLERGSQTGPQKLTTSGARTLAVSTATQSGASESERAFIVELEKIKKMSDEVENLMAYIEGEGQRTPCNQPPCFTKQYLNELELGIRNLADNCKTIKDRVEEKRQSLNNLRDENLQVDAWRLYVQSLAEQAAENRHQELWSRRKLTPDLDVKRKRVTKAEQALKQQIAALEEHVHHLELDNRKRVVSLKGGKKNVSRQTSTGRSQSIQNLYGTINGLLSSADHLYQQVAQQMEALNISTQSHITQHILKSVGLSSEDTLHVQSRPSFNGPAATSLVRQQLIYSSSLKAELGLPVHTTPPRRFMPSDSGVGAPSITRRKRDSMDGVQKALASVGGASPKTTIERVSHHTLSRQPNSSSTSSNMFVKHIRQRSFQESSEESSSQPRHVRRVLSSQARSGTSSPVPSPSSTSENKSSSVASGFSANSAVTSLQESQSSTIFDQQSGDSRPDSKRTASRNASLFAEKPGQTLTSRFGPPPSRTTTTPSLAVSTTPSAGGGFPFGSSPPNVPSEGVFKFSNSNPPNAVSFFSFATPTVPKPTGMLDSSGSMPSNKPANNVGATQSSSTGATASLSSFPSSGFGTGVSNTTSGSMSTTKLDNDSTMSGVDSKLKSSVESGKDDEPNFGFKAASSGTPSFGTPYFSSSAFSRPALSGSTQTATTLSSASFSFGGPANKAPGSQQVDATTKQNDTKQTVPYTSAPTQNIWIDQKSNLVKPTSTPEVSFSNAVSQTVSAQSSVALPLAANPAPLGSQVTSAAAPTNLPGSQARGSQPPSLLNEPASSSNLKSSSSALGSTLFALTSIPNAAPSLSSQTPFVFPAVSNPAVTFTVPPITTLVTDEEDMDEEQLSGGTTSLGGFSLGGLGLEDSSICSLSQAPKTNLFECPAPFGTQRNSSAFGTQQSSSAFGTQQSSSAFCTQPIASAFGTSSPQGQLFRPPSFSLPSAQSPPQTSGGFGFGTLTQPKMGVNPFVSAFGGTTTNLPSSNPFGSAPASPALGSPAQPGAGGFGQPSHLGPGQQALGSALGSFGQTRQMGFGSTSPFGSTPSAGFGSAASGSGFGAAGSGGGFASAATGGGFASAATGRGFAGAATGGGFGGAGGASESSFVRAAGGRGKGFGAFGGNSSGGFGGAGQPGFGTTNPPDQALFTQMRK